MTPSEVITALEKALEADQLTAGPWQVIETNIPHRLGGHHVERRIFATWDHPQLKGPLGVVNHSVGVGAEEGLPSIHLVQIDAPDAAFIAAANPLAIRTLLDAHASALRDAAKLREALRTLLPMFEAWHEEFPDDVGHKEGPALEAARAALDDNTKGAASHE